MLLICEAVGDCMSKDMLAARSPAEKEASLQSNGSE
jgi:hypothetical protein